jgi:hypothetical protein
MSFTFLVQPIIPNVEGGTWRFYVLVDYTEGAEPNVFVTSEVFGSKEETLEAAGTVIMDARALQLSYELNYGAHSNSYIARIMRHDTGALIARTQGYDQPEEVRAALQQLVDQCHLEGDDRPGLILVED